MTLGVSYPQCKHSVETTESPLGFCTQSEVKLYNDNAHGALL